MGNRHRAGSRELENLRKLQAGAFYPAKGWTWVTAPGHNGQVGAPAKVQPVAATRQGRRVGRSAAKRTVPKLSSGFLGPRIRSLICCRLPSPHGRLSRVPLLSLVQNQGGKRPMPNAILSPYIRERDEDVVFVSVSNCIMLTRPRLGAFRAYRSCE